MIRTRKEIHLFNIPDNCFMLEVEICKYTNAGESIFK